MNLKQKLQSVQNLSPSYFSMVMATGIVAIATQLFGYLFLAKLLFYINILSFAVLLILYVLRLIFYPKDFISDFVNPAKIPGFLTFVAASAILGNQFVKIENNYQIAFYFFIISIIFWIFLTYAFFTIITVKRNKPTLENAISGTWLLVIVSTQSISILSVLLLNNFPLITKFLLFFSLALFLLGCMFYFIIITLIVYRLSFFELTKDDFAPPYWINMGAAAITVLAGSTLILSIEKTPILMSFLPFIKGLTLMFWAFATWWIPLLIILGFWRHLIKHLPLKYVPQYWGMIFPLGMYTVCTVKMSEAFELPFLKGISSIFVWVAIGGWVVVFFSLLYSITFAKSEKSKYLQ
jgi:tellurite resistance protein TehA-like permease